MNTVNLKFCIIGKKYRFLWTAFTFFHQNTIGKSETIGNQADCLILRIKHPQTTSSAQHNHLV